MLKKYSKTFNSEKTLLPNIFLLIKSLPDQYFYFKRYDQLRHPGGILTRSTEEITKSMNRVFDFLPEVNDSIQKEEKNIKAQNLLAEIQYLIGHFDSFQDECYLVLKGLCPLPSEDKCPNEKFVYRWLKGNGFLCGEEFLVRTKNIQKYLDMFSNRLKHGNQCFEFVYVKAEHHYLPGVFIAELKGQEVREVYPWIPISMDKSTIAFSFNYFLKALVLCFYILCDALEDSIKKHLKIIHGNKWSKKEMQKHSDDFYQMILNVSSLPDVFYPYEHKKTPRIRMHGSDVKISYPLGDKIPYKGQLTASSMHKADGYTRDFSLPFFG